MVLFASPTINVNSAVTQIKQVDHCNQNVSSTYFANTYRLISDDINLLNWTNVNLFSTNLRLKNTQDDINSSWEDIEINEFDLVSSVKFSNIIKVKGKIKTISKYKPTIVID